MERRIRRLGIFMVLCFLALFVQLNNIQVFKANSLANDPNNPRVRGAGPQPDPGEHPLGRTGSPSGLVGAGSARQHRQVPAGLQPRTPPRLFAQIVGFDSMKYGNFRGIEAEYNSFLTPHTPPAKTLRDLLINRTEVDNVTLTVNREPAAAGGHRARPRPGARESTVPRRWSRTPPPAASRPCTPTRPSIPTRWCPRT